MPHDEKSPLLTSGDGISNRNSNFVPSSPGPKHQKRRNSDGSLDFERIVNGYSIEGELVTKMYTNLRISIGNDKTLALEQYLDSRYFRVFGDTICVILLFVCFPTLSIAIGNRQPSENKLCWQIRNFLSIL